MSDGAYLGSIVAFAVIFILIGMVMGAAIVAIARRPRCNREERAGTFHHHILKR